MKKGVAINIVVAAVIAFIALIVLWIFLSKMAPQLSSWIQSIVHKVKCEIIPWPFNKIFGC